MENKIKRGPLANTLALHYFEKENVDTVGWFKYIETWFASLGLSPTKMNGKGTKLISFSRGKKSLEKENYAHLKEEGQWIAAFPPDEMCESGGFGVLAIASLLVNNSFKRNDLYLIWADTICPKKDEIIKDFTRDLLTFTQPNYGYFFQREFKKGPDFYPWGILEGLNDHKNMDDRREAKEINNWSIIGLDEDDRYQPHMIRDVYPLNFLSRQHLDAKIGDITLEAWIKSDKRHGTLEEIQPGFWCWTVQEDHISELREILRPHNLIIAFMDT